MELDSLGSNLHSCLGCEEFCHCGVGAVGYAVIFLVVCRTTKQTGSLDLGLEVSHLELADAATELFTFLGIFYCLVHSALGDAESLASDTDTTSVEGLHGKTEAFAELTELTVLGDAAVFEDKFGSGRATDTHLLLFLSNREARVSLLDDESADTFGAKTLVGHSDDDEHVGVGAVGDENLAAIEHPVVAILDSHSLLTCGVGTGVRLCEAKGTYPFT